MGLTIGLHLELEDCLMHAVVSQEPEPVFAFTNSLHFLT